jgi:acetyl-CoA C-acetyltransferase
MSRVPMGSTIGDKKQKQRLGVPMSPRMQQKYPSSAKRGFSQFQGAELMCKKYAITRAQMERAALRSHQRAAHATAKGYFMNEIVPIKGVDKKSGAPKWHIQDEGVRPNVTLAGMAKLRTLTPTGRITAACASQIADGASAILVCNERGLRKLLGVKPMARVVALALAGTDPVRMLDGPIPSTQTALKRAGLALSDIDLYEVNEAFASVSESWLQHLGADVDKLNVNGGAMALGHPLGCTGTKLLTTLVHELQRRKARYGLVSICEGGGTANCTIVEAVYPAADGYQGTAIKSAL